MPPRLPRQITLALIALAIAGGVWLAHISGRKSDLRPPVANLSTGLSQDVYVWQRAWTPAVRDAIAAETSHFRRFVVLAAEISWRDHDNRTTRIQPDYAALSKSVHQIGLAIRIGPLPAALSTAMDPGSEQTRLILGAIANALSEARHAGLEVSEVQIDFDCAESKLAGYRKWVKAIKPAVSPTPLVITTLPSWLKHREFAELANEAGSFILQVHSLHRPSGPDSPMSLCDANEAKAAVAEAAKTGVPFRVALPTYSYLAGFSPAGKLLGLSAEGPEPAWPAGSILRVMRSDPASEAGLVREWIQNRSATLIGLIWYRLPVAGDTMNWRMATLSAVMAGREPQARVRTLVTNKTPGLLDIYLRNDGDADGTPQCEVSIAWNGADLVAAEGIGGFERIDGPAESVIFRATDLPVGRWIAPGEQMQIGWLRLSADKEVRTHVTPLSPD